MRFRGRVGVRGFSVGPWALGSHSEAYEVQGTQTTGLGLKDLVFGHWTHGTLSLTVKIMRSREQKQHRT